MGLGVFPFEVIVTLIDWFSIVPLTSKIMERTPCNTKLSKWLWWFIYKFWGWWSRCERRQSLRSPILDGCKAVTWHPKDQSICILVDTRNIMIKRFKQPNYVHFHLGIDNVSARAWTRFLNLWWLGSIQFSLELP